MASEKKPALGFIVVTLFLDILGLGLIIPILPRLVERFVGNDATEGAFYVGVLAASYALMQFVFSPIMGSLSDRFGRRPVLLLSLFGAGFDYVLLAFAPSLAWFFVGRVVAGFCGASIGTAAAYIADVSPPEKRAQNFGLIGMAFGLGFVAGPLLSAFLGTIDLPLPGFIANLTGYATLPGIRFPFLVAACLTLTNAQGITDADLLVIAGLTQLTHLEIGKLPLPDDRIPALKSFAFLKSLRLVPAKVPFTPEQQAKIQALLPQTKLEFK
jgi:MFS family permease